MKLPIKKEYFDMIEKEEKDIELRDAHLTLICESTGRTMRVEVEEVDIIEKKDVNKKFQYLFEDENIIRFFLKKK